MRALCLPALLLAAPARALCPFGMAEIEGRFCIDRHEASLIEQAKEGEKDWSPFHPPESGKSYKASSRPQRKPQGHISQRAAAAACRNAGKRLCSSAEWLEACKGPAKTKYPYGNEFQEGACNDHSRDKNYAGPVQRLFGARAEMNMRTMNDPRLNQLDRTLENSGAFPQCANGYGVLDMTGSLHEWVAETRKTEKKGELGTFRGGYYQHTEHPQHGEGCGYKTGAHGVDYYDYSIGFRCCADPIQEPR